MAEKKAEEMEVIDGEATEKPADETAARKKTDPRAAAEATAAAVKDAVGSLSKTVSSALEDRANVVMVRVNDEALRHMDMLVEAEVTKSRSESAAFLINEGIKSNQKLFDQVSDITDQIATLRTQLRGIIQPEKEEK